MNRRQAIAIISTLGASILGAETKAEVPSIVQGTSLDIYKPKPASIYIDLNWLKSVEIQFKGKTVTLSPDEIFKALNGK